MDEAQQLLLWRWSTLVQLSSLAMIAAFFALLARASHADSPSAWRSASPANRPAIALQIADQNMYKAKQQERGRE